VNKKGNTCYFDHRGKAKRRPEIPVIERRLAPCHCLVMTAVRGRLLPDHRPLHRSPCRLGGLYEDGLNQWLAGSHINGPDRRPGTTLIPSPPGWPQAPDRFKPNPFRARDVDTGPRPATGNPQKPARNSQADGVTSPPTTETRTQPQQPAPRADNRRVTRRDTPAGKERRRPGSTVRP